MKELELISRTLALVKILHENPSCGYCYGNEQEVVHLAPKTLEQVDKAIKACNKLQNKSNYSLVADLVG